METKTTSETTSETAASSERTISPRKRVKAALHDTKVATDYPEVGKYILRWFDEGSVEELTELRHNGAGKQVVLKYPPHVFMDIIRLAIKVHSVRRTYNNADKADIARVLMGTCLFNNSNLGTLLGGSRTAVSSWGAVRPESFPMQRLGGELSVESLILILTWWEDLLKAPTQPQNSWYLHRAYEEGATWPVIARLTGQTVQQAKKLGTNTTKEKTVVVNIGVAASDPGDSPRSTRSRAEGHPAGGSEGGPEHDDLEVEGESLLKPPASVVAGHDAFAPAVYLAANDEADDGDAGYADSPEDGVPAGNEGAVGEGTGSTGRGVHPFLQS